MHVEAAPWLTRSQRPRVLDFEGLNCSALDDLPSSLAVTYWFQAPTAAPAAPFTVRLKGRLEEPAEADETDESTGVDAFDELVHVEGVPPNAGWVSVTTRIAGVRAGRWAVTAASPADTVTLTNSGRTTFHMLAADKAPGMRLGAWPLMVFLGFLLGVALQWLTAERLGIGGGRLTWLTVLASVLGLLGAKAYYASTHRRQSGRWGATGMSLQGFVIVLLGILVPGLLLLGIPVGTALDASAPGLLTGMAIGRLGCFLGGCCSGRPTSSRWGLWSSDRHLGIRRIPVQLMESGWAVLVALSSLAALTVTPHVGRGAVLLGALSAQLVGRQFLLRLRSLPRATKHGLVLVRAAATIGVMAATVALI